MANEKYDLIVRNGEVIDELVLALLRRISESAATKFQRSATFPSLWRSRIDALIAWWRLAS